MDNEHSVEEAKPKKALSLIPIILHTGDGRQGKGYQSSCLGDRERSAH